MTTAIIHTKQGYSVLWASYVISEKEKQQAKGAISAENQEAIPAGIRVFPCKSQPEAAELAALLER